MPDYKEDIMKLLRDGTRFSTKEIIELLGASRNTTEKYLKILEAENKIKSEKIATCRIYWCNNEQK